MAKYHYISGSYAANIEAKNMKDACIKATKAQLSGPCDEKELVCIYVPKIKVCKGKLPENWV